MSRFYTFLIFFICVNIFSQTVIKGVVRNENDEPVSYCAVGIKDTKSGAVSDENGNYLLQLPEDQNGNVIFESAGYTPKVFTVEELKVNTKVVLAYAEKNIEEITVNVSKMKEKTIGQKSRPMLTFSKMFDHNVPTIEQGNIFKIYEKTKLQSYSFYIIPSSKFENITLKLNIYNIQNNLPHQSLLNENIIYTAKTTGWQTIDLTQYNIKLKNTSEIAVTLQLLNYKPIDKIDFVFGISAKKTLSKNLLFRYQSQGKWEESEGSFISNIKIKYSKTKNEKDAEYNEEEINIKDKRTNNLFNFYENQERAKKTIYGRSKSGNFIDVTNGKIYYEEYGKGFPLILLHGNNGSISDFYQQIPFLSKYFRVIAIDTRGQGRSTDMSSEEFSYEQFASNLSKVFQDLNIKKADILGWSDGGNTGLIFNCKNPDLVNKLIVIGANLNPAGVNEEFINSLKQQILNGIGNLKLLKLMVNNPQITTSDLDKINNPVLVIAGSEDLIKPEHTKLIHQSIKNSELEIIPDTTHYIPFEKPDELNKLILNFLRK